MTKPPPLPDHIGWDLLRAARIWEADFVARMVAAGHGWYGEARGRMAEFIGRDGALQTDIVNRSGLTKQAVAQHLDDLARDGIITRIPDPDDSRKRRVIYTQAGLKAKADADRIKFEIEEAFAQAEGDKALRALKSAVKTFIASTDRQDT